MHQWVSRRSTATLSQCFHAQSCGNIICWIHTVGCFPFFSYFTLSVSLPLLGPFSLVSTCQLLPSVTGVCGNGLTHHPQSVMQGIWGITCNRRVTDLRLAVRHVVTVTLRLLLAARDETRFSVLTFKLEYKLYVMRHLFLYFQSSGLFFCSFISSAIWSFNQYQYSLLYCYCINYRWAPSSAVIFRARASYRFLYNYTTDLPVNQVKYKGHFFVFYWLVMTGTSFNN